MTDPTRPGGPRYKNLPGLHGKEAVKYWQTKIQDAYQSKAPKIPTEDPASPPKLKIQKKKISALRPKSEEHRKSPPQVNGEPFLDLSSPKKFRPENINPRGTPFFVRDCAGIYEKSPEKKQTKGFIDLFQRNKRKISSPKMEKPDFFYNNNKAGEFPGVLVDQRLAGNENLEEITKNFTKAYLKKANVSYPVQKKEVPRSS
jgi:hypothetical protein